jgi:hypothetical protein
MTAWDEYVAAVTELDTVRRDAATAVAGQESAVRDARAELARVRARVGLQRTRLGAVSESLGRPVPVLDPEPADRAAAVHLVPPSVMDPTPAVSAALKGAWAGLDAADATVTIAAEAPSGDGFLASWPPPARNALPYAWYALLALIALVIVNGFAGSSPSAAVVALGFDLVVPAGAFLLGALSIGLLYGQTRDGRSRRSVVLGVMICVIPMLIGIALSVF